MFTPPIRQQSILRTLIAGFTLVIVLLLAGGYVLLSNITQIKEGAASLVAQDIAATELIDELQSEQAAVSWVFYKLSRDPQSLDKERVMAELDDADSRMHAILAAVAGKPQEAMWRKLAESCTGFTKEARRLLALETLPETLPRDLFRRHADVLKQAAAIIRSNDRGALEAQRQIDRHSRELILRSALVFSACLALALVCATLTVRVTTTLSRRMEAQAGELSRVSWQMLENQETTARRFSHELHDELGQALTAMKANLVALQNGGGDQARLKDCLALVDDAIVNVRQMSQLLRPTILDDFGLDAALRWLGDRFMQRTQIEVTYESNFAGRLPDETETHVFRVAQEALTNVARHSGASKVRMELEAANGHIRLGVSDNGKGLESVAGQAAKGMGMSGMRARARSAGGELHLRPAAGGGLMVEVQLPIKHQEQLTRASSVQREELPQNAHPVGR